MTAELKAVSSLSSVEKKENNKSFDNTLSGSENTDSFYGCFKI